jgi:hypothetical protein
MKIPVFDVKSHGQPHIGIGGQLFATRTFGGRPAERKNRRVFAFNHFGAQFDFDRAPVPGLATNCQVAGGPASNEARFFAFSGERNPSALTQTRMRLTKIQRSTGTLAFKFAPRTQSYLEFTRPKSTHIRAMPPMPLVKRTRSEDENEDEDDGEGDRKRIAAETRGEVVAQRSKISSASTAFGAAENRQCEPSPTGMDWT